VVVPKTWFEVQSIIIAKAARDEAYRRRVLEDPLRVAEEENGERYPEDVRIRVIEGEPETGYIVLPPRMTATDELSDAALESVSGGAGSTTTTSTSTGTTTTLSRGGWDGNHIETMRRSVGRAQ
jgi:hypothetical protein